MHTTLSSYGIENVPPPYTQKFLALRRCRCRLGCCMSCARGSWLQRWRCVVSVVYLLSLLTSLSLLNSFDIHWSISMSLCTYIAVSFENLSSCCCSSIREEKQTDPCVSDPCPLFFRRTLLLAFTPMPNGKLHSLSLPPSSLAGTSLATMPPSTLR